MAVPANLLLTGFMGTGKTTVGRLLADRLGMPFVDTDQIIEQRHGPIDQIFRRSGEAGFRELEREVAIDVAAQVGQVIATGGRMLLDPVNLEALGNNGHIFCLVASPDEIRRRVGEGRGVARRPLLETDPDRSIVELMKEREPGYARFTQVVTDGKDPVEVVDEIIGLWQALDRVL